MARRAGLSFASKWAPGQSRLSAGRIILTTCSSVLQTGHRGIPVSPLLVHSSLAQLHAPRFLSLQCFKLTSLEDDKCSSSLVAMLKVGTPHPRCLLRTAKWPAKVWPALSLVSCPDDTRSFNFAWCYLAPVAPSFILAPPCHLVVTRVTALIPSECATQAVKREGGISTTPTFSIH